jgi:hypothetical protein
MKTKIIIRNMVFICGLALLALSCHKHDEHSHSHDEEGSHSHEATEATVQHGAGDAFNSPYVCPMHCEDSGSTEAGQCPACGMDYVAFAAHIKDGHNH